MINGSDQVYSAAMSAFVDNDGSTEMPYLSKGIDLLTHLTAIFTAAYVQCPLNSQPLEYEENAQHGLAQALAVITVINRKKNEDDHAADAESYGHNGDSGTIDDGLPF